MSEINVQIYHSNQLTFPIKAWGSLSSERRLWPSKPCPQQSVPQSENEQTQLITMLDLHIVRLPW